MSGKKSTEVSDMLARGGDARNSVAENYKGRMRASEKTLQENQKKLDDIYRRINAQKIQISEESRREFFQESQRLQELFDTIKKSNKQMDYTRDIKHTNSEKQRLQTALENADREQERIRISIRDKDWYCDKEYKDAKKLVKEYQKIAESQNRLVADFSKKEQESNQTVIRYQLMEKQMLQLIEEEKNLNKKAVEIVQLRKKAADSKQYVQDAFQKIDQNLVDKFLSTEGKQLQKEISTFMGLTDAAAVEKITELSEKISMFSSKLEQCYSEYLERIEQIKSAIKHNQNSLEKDHNFYFEPVDYFKNKGGAQKISVLDYIAEYGNKNELVTQIRRGIDKANQLLEKEQFDEAEQQTLENDKWIEQANQYAALLQSHLIENFYVAKDMTKVMKSMGFETGAYKIDGHIKNGWKISASNPNGESIDFTKVFLDDAGEMNIEIDHKTLGDCPSRWSEICNKFEDMGIYIEKIVMENGSVVLDKRSGKNEDCSVAENENQQAVQQ